MQISLGKLQQQVGYSTVDRQTKSECCFVAIATLSNTNSHLAVYDTVLIDSFRDSVNQLFKS